MKKLNVDLELLVQSFSFNEDNLGKEYLDTHTGDIINIPQELNRVVQGKMNEDELDDWQKELLKDAYNIQNDNEHRYIIVPNIEDSYLHEVMVNFAEGKIVSEQLRENLLSALKENQPTREFKNIIFKYGDILELWQDYEEEKFKEYAVKWLRGRGIELE